MLPGCSVPAAVALGKVIGNPSVHQAVICGLLVSLFALFESQGAG